LVTLGIGDAPGGLVVLALAAAVVAALIGAGRSPKVRSLPSLPAVVWAARFLLIAGAAFGAFLLVKDIAQVV
ncbi:MAG: hypothetical protein WD627_09205, partial [Actinomycetota bacterium]